MITTIALSLALAAFLHFSLTSHAAPRPVDLVAHQTSDGVVFVHTK